MSFSTLISQYAGRNKGHLLSDAELAELLVEAKLASDAHPAEWATFRVVLTKFTDLTAPEAKADYRMCRITADLGAYPYSVTEFIPLYLRSRGYAMTFSGHFGNDADADYILNQMSIWSHEIIGAAPVFADSQIRAAWSNYIVEQRARLMRAGYDKVAFDPTADASELKRFSAFVTMATPDDPAKTARDVRATEVALMNFIFRAKNHMRERWHHGIHMMPVFYGPQGSGKTTAVRHLLSPLEDYTSAVGFDVFEHDSKMYTLSTIPVMFFDELAGISKAENERLKDIMHSRQRELRKIYGSPVNRTLISSFIGCTNKELGTLIRDETGNRRYLQIDTPTKLDRADIMAFDALAMWRAVDEDGEPPLYANAEDLKAVQDVQAVQRHQSNVESWIDADITVPDRPLSAGELFTGHFVPWLDANYPGQARFENVVKFGKELQRIIRCEHPRLAVKHGATKKLYTVQPSEPIAPERAAFKVRFNGMVEGRA